MKRRVYFFAKVGNLNEKPYGGGEVGNRRTMSLLEELGYEIKLIPRYCCYKPKSVLVYIQMILGDSFAWLRLVFTLFFCKRNNSAVHISGFTGAYMYYEALAVIAAKILGYKVIYEIRGGGIIGFYETGSALYKLCFKLAVSLPICVFSQGLENKPLIESCHCKRFFYYPNYVTKDFMPTECPEKDNSNIKMVFLGRISPTKNVDVAIHCLEEVQKHYPQATLDIIGDGEDHPDYVNTINEYIDINLTESCTFHGKKDKNELKELLRDKTFFIFPSEEKREGQSNSLTETMSYGIIPIASPQGYTRSIVGFDELIVDRVDAKEYANRIVRIGREDRIAYYSNEMYNRIKALFTEEKVQASVKSELEKVFRV